MVQLEMAALGPPVVMAKPNSTGIPSLIPSVSDLFDYLE